MIIIRTAILFLFAGMTLLTQSLLFESFAQEGALQPQGGSTLSPKVPGSDTMAVTMKSQEDAGEMPLYKAPLREAPLYKAPLRGAPGGRLSGGTRGIESKMSGFALLAPRHTGLTLSEQPTLYWFSSQATKYPVKLAILMGKEMKPILQVRITDESRAGFHPIRLADHGIRLQTGVVYQCFVSMVMDTKDPSKDIISGGAIERITCSKHFQKTLKETEPKRIPHVFAEEGLWYDAMETLCSRIDATPHDSLLHKQRISLLRQGELTEAADYETALRE